MWGCGGKTLYSEGLGRFVWVMRVGLGEMVSCSLFWTEFGSIGGG